MGGNLNAHESSIVNRLEKFLHVKENEMVSGKVAAFADLNIKEKQKHKF